jgi:hypothetical protein
MPASISPRRGISLGLHQAAGMRQNKTTRSSLPLFIRVRQAPEHFGISERQVRYLMMRGDPHSRGPGLTADGYP